MGMQSFHFVPYRSAKWNAEGMRSDRNASDRIVPFQNMERLKSDTKSGKIRNRSIPFPTESANGKYINGTIAFQSEHKTNWYAIVPFPCEQPICPFQKLERRWNGTIVFPCELSLNVNGHHQAMPSDFKKNKHSHP